MYSHKDFEEIAKSVSSEKETIRTAEEIHLYVEEFLKLCVADFNKNIHMKSLTNDYKEGVIEATLYILDFINNGDMTRL